MGVYDKSGMAEKMEHWEKIREAKKPKIKTQEDYEKAIRDIHDHYRNKMYIPETDGFSEEEWQRVTNLLKETCNWEIEHGIWPLKKKGSEVP